jgi:pantetheine-phosphate adenylyltransferase
MGTIAVYPGTFDPFTKGHMDIALRTARIFPEVIILIANNPNKKSMFSIDEREDMIEAVLDAFSSEKITNDWFANTTFSNHDGLLADYITKLAGRGVKPVVIRGLRAMSDFENEFQMAHVNRTLSGSMDTMFIPTSSEYFFVSSSTVREIFKLGGDISKFVPPQVLELMKAKKKAPIA